MRKAAIQLSMSTHSSLMDYLGLPAQELWQICREVQEEWQRKQNLNSQSR